MADLTCDALAEQGVSCIKFRNVLDALEIKNSAATAVVSPYGAHVLSYVPAGEKDVLWVSGKSEFSSGKPIRGGVPVCWPWFGPAGTPSHGTARISLWKLVSAVRENAELTTVKFFLDASKEHGLTVEMTLKVGKKLEIFLTTKNVSSVKKSGITEALHTYFAIGDVKKVAVSGFDGAGYFSKVTNERLVRKGDIVFSSETDDVYDDDFTSPATITDGSFGRRILVERGGSRSSVVWNPWIAKSQKMADFGDDEYNFMVCVEAANAGNDAIDLAPGEEHTLSTAISIVG